MNLQMIFARCRFQQLGEQFSWNQKHWIFSSICIIHFHHYYLS
uniref:Alternative protein RANBP17 n=1 Tax=Homo sapiens TaxID=9606 RepID=L8E953_HUMAN|nr:alternative protein RANBP17 [Homo sapiens]